MKCEISVCEERNGTNLRILIFLLTRGNVYFTSGERAEIFQRVGEHHE